MNVASPRRIVLHAGFHRTGTTSVQHTFWENGKHLWPHCALALPWRTRGTEAVSLAGSFHKYGKPHLLQAFEAECCKLFRTFDLGTKRHLVISEENFAGRMPGRDDQAPYWAMPALIAAIARALRHVFGSDIELHLIFTTRAQQDWIASIFRHLVRHTRLTDDLKTFTEQIGAQLDLTTLMKHTSETANAQLHHNRLEELTTAEGPAKPILDLIDLPPHLRGQIKPASIRHRSPSAGLISALLDLNRRAQDDHTIDAKKRRLIDRYEAENGRT